MGGIDPREDDVRPQGKTAVLALRGPAASVVLLAPGSHSPKWAEAWQVFAPEPTIGQPRWFLVRIEHEGTDAVGFAVIDDVVIADARKAQLPETLGITARIVALLPTKVNDVEQVTEQSRWIVKQLARYIAREAGDPPHMDYEIAQWRAVLGVLIEAVNDPAVRDHLTE